jgi:hypothetical protein
MSPSLWSRVKQAQIVQVLVVYAGASWLVLEIASVFIAEFELPGWFFQATILFLLLGLIVLGTTAWVQMRVAGSHSQPRMRPPWEVNPWLIWNRVIGPTRAAPPLARTGRRCRGKSVRRTTDPKTTI